jgi:hypothetical protein
VSKVVAKHMMDAAFAVTVVNSFVLIAAHH